MSEGILKKRNLILLVVMASVVLLFLIDFKEQMAGILIGINYILISIYYGVIIYEQVKMRRERNFLFYIISVLSMFCFALGVFQFIR